MSKDYKTFFQEVEDALTIYSHNLNKIIYESPNIHNKILRAWTDEQHTLNILETKVNKLFGEKYHYYRYEYDVNLGSKDVAIFYVKKDEEYLKELKKFNTQKVLVETIERWMKKAERMNFEVKSAIEVIKYLDGS